MTRLRTSLLLTLFMLLLGGAGWFLYNSGMAATDEDYFGAIAYISLSMGCLASCVLAVVIFRE